MNTYEYAKAKQRNQTIELGCQLIKELQPLVYRFVFKKNGKLNQRSEAVIADILDKYYALENVSYILIDGSKEDGSFSVKIRLQGCFVEAGKDHGLAIYTDQGFYSKRNSLGHHDLQHAIDNPPRLLDVDNMPQAKKRVSELAEQANKLIDEINELKTKHGIAGKRVDTIYL